MSAAATDNRIRALRPPKPAVDPGKAHGFLIEDERRPGGQIERALTVFLSGAECPFTCAFCDLWRWTIDGATPPGALEQQLTDVLRECGPDLPTLGRLKLYNASNWFDRRAVPAGDAVAIAALAAPFAGVTVESHASTVGAMTLEFADRLAGRLEVAIGLETIHPIAAPLLNKRLDLPRFDRAARFLADHNLNLRVFVLLGAPHIPVAESVEWTARSVAYAVERGASVVSIIPVRGGNGEMERLAEGGEFVPPTLVQLETALETARERCVAMGPAVITADLWDAERLPACASCRDARIARMHRLHLTDAMEPSVTCADCAPP